MAITYGFYLRKDRAKDDGRCPIYLRITENRKSKFVSTGVAIKPKYWNKSRREVRQNDYYNADHINKIIRDKIKEVRDEAYRLKAADQPISADIIKRKAKNSESYGCFISYAKKFADRKRRVNVQTGRRYDAIVSKLRKYTGDTLSFNDLTVTWLKEFSDWLATERKNKANTIHSNLRAIRAILYSAIEEGLFPQEKNPFFKLKLKQPKVSKTKLTAQEIKKFAKQQTDSTFQELARDLYLFSFFTCGMRFRDVATLKYKNLNGTHIHYEMNKTGNAQIVEIFPTARDILNKYKKRKASSEDFVFPLVDVEKILGKLKHVDKKLTVADLAFDEAPTGKQQKVQKQLDRDISSKNAYVNKEIKKLARRAEIGKKISFHSARHSYADIARGKNANLHHLSKSLGHSSLKVTENYLSSLGNEVSNSAAKTVYEEF